MSLADFIMHLTKHGCEVTPLEGGNLTGMAIRVYNPHNKKSCILQLYNGGEVSNTTIKETCLVRLFIDTP